MKKLLLYLGLAAAAFGQNTPTAVTKYGYGDSHGQNVIANGPVIVGSGNTITIASGGTLTLSSGAITNFSPGTIAWSGLGSIPSPTFSLTGDATTAVTLSSSGGVSNALTLATVNSGPGTYGDSSHVPQVTVNGKGLVTAASSIALSASSLGALQIANNLSDVASAVTSRANLGVAIGVNVEPWSAQLDIFAANGSNFYVNTTQIPLPPASGQILVGNSGGTAFGLQSMSGDATLNSAGALTVSHVNGVAYGTSPSTNTVPVVTGTNAITYETIPNAALAHASVTIGTTAIALGASSTTLGGLTTLNGMTISSTGNGFTFAGGSGLTDNASGQLTLAAGGTSQNLVLAGSGTTGEVVATATASATGGIRSYRNGSTSQYLDMWGGTGNTELVSIGGKTLTINSDVATSTTTPSILLQDTSTSVVNLRLWSSGNVSIQGAGTDNANGELQLASSTAASGGIAFGNDSPQASIYRSAASTLTSPAAWAFTSTTTSSSTTTGAITDAGGLGVAGAAYIGGVLNVASSITASGAIYGASGGSASSPSYAFTSFLTTGFYPANPGIGVTVAGTTAGSWTATALNLANNKIAFGGGSSLVDSSGAITIATSGSSTGITLNNGASTFLTIEGSGTIYSRLQFNSSANMEMIATSPCYQLQDSTTITVGGRMIFNNAATDGLSFDIFSSGTWNNALNITSALGVKVVATTASTASNVGALTDAGGLGVSGAAFIGGLLNVAGTSQLSGIVGVGGTPTAGIPLYIQTAVSGANAQGLAVAPSITATANSQNFFVENFAGDSINTATFTGQTYQHVYVGTPTVTGSGTITGGWQLDILAPAAGMTGAINVVSGAVNLGSGATTTGSLVDSGAASFASGFGYVTGGGTGGTIAQATSRTTAVTLNKLTGSFSLFSAVGSATPATFTFDNNTILAGDTVEISEASGTNQYLATCTAIATGTSFNVTFYSMVGTATDAPVFNFKIIRGSTN